MRRLHTVGIYGHLALLRHSEKKLRNQGGRGLFLLGIDQEVCEDLTKFHDAGVWSISHSSGGVRSL